MTDGLQVYLFSTVLWYHIYHTIIDYHSCFRCLWELIVLVQEMFFLWLCLTNHISFLLYPCLKDKNICPNIALSRNRNKTNVSLLRANKSVFIVEFCNIRHVHVSSSSLQGSGDLHVALRILSVHWTTQLNKRTQAAVTSFYPFLEDEA